MVVVLGELGGRDEYSLVEALKQGKIYKPVVAWVSGTCATLFKSEVQFGHAVSSISLISASPRNMLQVVSCENREMFWWNCFLSLFFLFLPFRIAWTV